MSHHSKDHKLLVETYETMTEKSSRKTSKVLWFAFSHGSYKEPVVTHKDPQRMGLEYKIAVDKPYMIIAWSDECVYALASGSNASELQQAWNKYVEESDWVSGDPDDPEEQAMKRKLTTTPIKYWVNGSSLDLDSSEGMVLFVNGSAVAQASNADIRYF